MDQTLLKYWKTCLQDAERKAIALKGPRITLTLVTRYLNSFLSKVFLLFSLIGKQKTAMKNKK